MQQGPQYAGCRKGDRKRPQRQQKDSQGDWDQICSDKIGFDRGDFIQWWDFNFWGHLFTEGSAKRVLSDPNDVAKYITDRLSDLSKLVEAMPIIVAVARDESEKEAEKIHEGNEYARGVLEALKSIK